MKLVGIMHMLSGEAATVVNALRQQYDPRTALAIDAHVTLAGPWESEEPISSIEAELVRLADEVEPFELTIAGAKSFPPPTPVCYLGVEPVRQLVALHHALVRQLGWRDRFPYVPHATIAEYLPEEETRMVVEELRRLDICVHDQVRILSLLRLVEKAPDGRWIPATEVPIGRGRATERLAGV